MTVVGPNPSSVFLIANKRYLDFANAVAKSFALSIVSYELVDMLFLFRVCLCREIIHIFWLPYQPAFMIPPIMQFVIFHSSNMHSTEFAYPFLDPEIF